MQDPSLNQSTTNNDTSQQDLLAADEQAIAALGEQDYIVDTSDEVPTPLYDFAATQEQIDTVFAEQPLDVQENMPIPTWLDGFVAFLDAYNNPNQTQSQ